MPHITLEYSANLSCPPSGQLLERLHNLLPRIGPFELLAIKSRMIEHSVFLIADGGSDAAFIHLELAILSGRDAETKREVSNQLLEFLSSEFASCLKTQQISLTVEVREMNLDCYSKVSTIRR